MIKGSLRGGGLPLSQTLTKVGTHERCLQRVRMIEVGLRSLLHREMGKVSVVVVVADVRHVFSTTERLHHRSRKCPGARQTRVSTTALIGYMTAEAAGCWPVFAFACEIKIITQLRKLGFGDGSVYEGVRRRFAWVRLAQSNCIYRLSRTDRRHVTLTSTATNTK